MKLRHLYLGIIKLISVENEGNLYKIEFIKDVLDQPGIEDTKRVP